MANSQNKNSSSRKNRIVIKSSVIFEFRGEGAWALDTEMQSIVHFSGAATKIARAISESHNDGISLNRLVKEIPECRRAEILSVLCELRASGLIEGFNPSTARSASLKPTSLLLGAFSLGAGVMLFPASAHSMMNCMGPPSCTALGGVCGRDALGNNCIKMAPGPFADYCDPLPDGPCT